MVDFIRGEGNRLETGFGSMIERCEGWRRCPEEGRFLGLGIRHDLDADAGASGKAQSSRARLLDATACDFGITPAPQHGRLGSRGTRRVQHWMPIAGTGYPNVHVLEWHSIVFNVGCNLGQKGCRESKIGPLCRAQTGEQRRAERRRVRRGWTRVAPIHRHLLCTPHSGCSSSICITIRGHAGQQISQISILRIIRLQSTRQQFKVHILYNILRTIINKYPRCRTRRILLHGLAHHESPFHHAIP
mmetsp:Transcript_5235/g.11875  ORF Transcript_5235/g.11875 Transcript_5235/m.11875 type:complete len:245 (+) Transcript_5235:1432-2166(+)